MYSNVLEEKKKKEKVACLLFSLGFSKITEAEAGFFPLFTKKITGLVILEMFTTPVKA